MEREMQPHFNEASQARFVRAAPPLLISRGKNDVERHGQKEIEDQDRKRRINDCFGSRPSHPDRAFAAR